MLNHRIQPVDHTVIKDNTTKVFGLRVSSCPDCGPETCTIRVVHNDDGTLSMGKPGWYAVLFDDGIVRCYEPEGPFGFSALFGISDPKPQHIWRIRKTETGEYLSPKGYWRKFTTQGKSYGRKGDVSNALVSIRWPVKDLEVVEFEIVERNVTPAQEWLEGVAKRRR